MSIDEIEELWHGSHKLEKITKKMTVQEQADDYLVATHNKCYYCLVRLPSDKYRITNRYRREEDLERHLKMYK